MRTIILIAAAAMLLVGCKGKPSGADPVAALRPASAPAPEAAGASAQAGATKAPAPSAPMLAYAYQASIEVPASRVRGLMDRHSQACVAAGAAVCQVVGASTGADGDRVSGSLSLRAAPAWLTHFRAGLDADARAAGGRVTSTSVQTEDLSRSIVDTDAAVRAKTTLRDRLQALLASRPANVGDLVQLEEALAKVQGELDASQSELAMMRGRVETSTFDLQYNSAAAAVSGDAVRPLKIAATQFLNVSVQTVALLIYLLAVLAPLVLVGAPIWWLVLRWRRRRRALRAAVRPDAAP